MRALLASPLGFLIGLSLGALGGGGSILAVPALVYVGGQGAKAATTTSLVVVGATSLGGMVAHWRAGRVRARAGLVFGLAGVGGSLAGSHLNRSVDPDVLLLAFSGVMVMAAWRMLARVRTTGGVPTPVATFPDGPGAAVAVGLRVPTAVSAATVAKVAVAGTFVGLMTGFFGVGGGFVIVPALVLALGFPMPEAVGTSLLVIAVNSAVALSARASTVGVDWHVALPFTLAGLAGSSVGNRVAGRVDARMLVRWFAGLLVVVAVYTAIRSAAAL